MPVYPFRCPDCEDLVEVTASIKTGPTAPVCGGCDTQMVRVLCVPFVPRTSTQYFSEAMKDGGLHPRDREDFRRMAEAAGVSTSGKVYQSGLARYPGDPFAWVGDLDEAKAKIRTQGKGCDDLGIKPAEAVAPPRVRPLGEDLVQAELNAMVAAGKIDRREKKKHREAVIDRITPDFQKKGGVITKARPADRKARRAARGAK